MSTQLVPVQDIERMAAAMAASNFFGLRTAEQAMALMLVAQAEGLHPAKAMQEYHIIQGKPALRSDAMLARFQAAGGSVRWKTYTDELVVGLFSHPQGGEIEVSWDMARAKKAGLGGKDNWQKFPRQMLRARCISEGVRTVYPGVTVGSYAPEEMADEPVRQPEREVVGERVDAPAIGRIQLEGEIDRADTEEMLEDLVPLIQQLGVEDRNALRARFSAQKHRIKNRKPVVNDVDGYTDEAREFFGEDAA